MTSAVTIETLNAFFEETFPGIVADSPDILLLEKGRAVIRQIASEKHIRPGNIISGPTQMALADHAAYLAIFTELGIVPMAVTSNLSINFLRPCRGKAVDADARILKLGRSLAVIDVSLKIPDSKEIASHAVVTYALPATDQT